MIGKSAIRKDAESKVLGTEKYIADMDLSGALHAVTIRSTIARGTIKSIRFDPSFDWKGITKLSAENFPGRNFVTMIKTDYPALCDGKVNFPGEAVCLLAGEERARLEEAKKHVVIEYDELPAIFSIEESLARKVILLEPDNVLSRWSIRKGNTKEGFAASDVIVEGEYRTGPVEHAYLEPNGVVAVPIEGGIEVTGSIQCPFYIHNALMKAFDLPDEKVIVRQSPTGGAFGGKEDFPSVLAVHAAALAIETGRPVKLLYERHEDIISSPKRHPSLVRHKTGVRKDGTLEAMQIDMFLDGGAYSTMSPVVLQRGVLHATGPYRCPNVEINGKAMTTNHVPRGAFRGFGTPQAIFAIERHMDRIAERLGMDPLEIRDKNAVVLGDSLATGQILKESTAARLILDRVGKLSDFRSKWRAAKETVTGEGNKRRGVGLSLYFHGGAFTGSGEMRIKARSAVRLKENCEGVDILAGTVEMGQGFSTVISQIAASTLEIDMSRVSVATPDTSVVPDSGPTVASRSTMVVGSIVIKACKSLIGRLIKLVSCRHKVSRGEIAYRSGAFYDEKGAKLETFSSASRKYIESGGNRTFEETFSLPPGYNWDDETMRGDAYPCYSWAADVIEVEVDMDTFQITPVKATLVFDPGRAINPQAAVGQFEGGTLQAIGYGSIEEMKYLSGVLLNDRLATYMIPTASDCPEYQTEIVEIPYSYGPFGAKGIGELPYNGAGPALASAVENATGIPINNIPVTPEYLIEEWLDGGPARRAGRMQRRTTPDNTK